MAMGLSSKSSETKRSSSVSALVTLLGVYAALYLAVVGALHFATSPDAAAAVVPEGTGAQTAVTATPAEPMAGTSDVAATALIDPEGPDDARECSGVIDTSCVYN